MTTLGETVYTETYYTGYNGHGYGREGPMLPFMRHVAGALCTRYPTANRILEAGCAVGFLVEALRDRGRDAWGFDCSRYAIGQVRSDIRPYCWVADLATVQIASDPFDLVVCIEVLEHMPPAEAEAGIAALCRAACRSIVFSSTPSDFTEPTHCNVQPEAYWLALFDRHGFHKMVAAPYIAPQAIELERRQ